MATLTVPAEIVPASILAGFYRTARTEALTRALRLRNLARLARLQGNDAEYRSFRAWAFQVLADDVRWNKAREREQNEKAQEHPPECVCKICEIERTEVREAAADDCYNEYPR